MRREKGERNRQTDRHTHRERETETDRERERERERETDRQTERDRESEIVRERSYQTVSSSSQGRGPGNNGHSKQLLREGERPNFRERDRKGNEWFDRGRYTNPPDPP